MFKFKFKFQVELYCLPLHGGHIVDEMSCLQDHGGYINTDIQHEVINSINIHKN